MLRGMYPGLTTDAKHNGKSLDWLLNQVKVFEFLF